MALELIAFTLVVMGMAFLCGIYAGHDHGVKQGIRIGHRQAYDWSKRWGDVGQ